MLLTSSLSHTIAGDHPQRFGHTGYVTAAELPAKPAVVWSHQPARRDTGVSDGVVYDDVVYFGDDEGVLHARSIHDGTPIWTHHHGERIYFTPAADEERVYIATRAGVAAIRRDTGQQEWILRSQPGGQPAIAGDKVFVGCYDGKLYGLSAASGDRDVFWSHNVMQDAPRDPPGFSGERARFSGYPVRPSKAATDGDLFCQSLFDQCRVVAVDCQTGERRWAFQTKGWILARPTITGGHVFVGSQDKHLYCVDKQTGEEVWSFPSEKRVESGASVHGDAVYFASCDGCVYRVDLRTGEQVWKYEIDEPRKSIYSRPVITDDAVYFATGYGRLYAVDAATGELMWNFRPFPNSEMYSSPTTDGHRLFVNVRPSSGGLGVNAFVAIGEAQSDE